MLQKKFTFGWIDINIHLLKYAKIFTNFFYTYIIILNNFNKKNTRLHISLIFENRSLSPPPPKKIMFKKNKRIKVIKILKYKYKIWLL